MSIGYWNYYDDNFNWRKTREAVWPSDAESVRSLVREGFNTTDAQRYVESGYVCLPDFGIVIDRYHGGALSSIDFRTRFPQKSFKRFEVESKKTIWFHRATSWSDAKEAVDSVQKSLRFELCFRGQTQHYQIKRQIQNPHLTTHQLGEISLLPSLWRRMLARHRNSYCYFENLTLFEWSSLLYSQFDMDDIERRHKALSESGEMIITMGDMEDCSDPVLREFGGYRLLVAQQLNYGLADLLATLLQHYGLYSPVLDVTSSLDVAAFFATHKYITDGRKHSYQFVGTNDHRAVIYLLRLNREMERFHDHLNVLRDLKPLRPERQYCAIARTAPLALNLPADFVVGAVQLDFDLIEPVNRLTVDYLFPPPSEDRFLNAFLGNGYAKDRLSVFN